MRILVRIPYFLGDAIMDSAFLNALTECYPDSTIDIIISKNLKELAEMLPGFDNAHYFSKKEYKGPLGNIKYGRHILATAGRYDIFFCTTHSFSSALMGFFTRSKKRVGFRIEGRRFLFTHSYPWPKEVVHRTEASMILLSHFVGRKLNPKPFRFSLEHPISMKMPKGHTIVFNVNSGGIKRMISIPKAASIIETLKTHFNSTIILTGTKQNREYVGKLVSSLQDSTGVLDWSGRTDLLQLALVLKNADLVISANTGTAHLANAFGTNLIVYIGFADHRLNRPFNKQNLVVLNKKDLPCAPCASSAKCKFSELKCITEIPNQAIVEAARDLQNGNDEISDYIRYR